MSNLNLNRISAVLSDADLTAAEQLIDDCQNLFPFLTELDGEDIRNMVHINVNNHRFVEETLAVMNYVDLVMPPHVDLAEIERDIKLYDQLDQFIVRLEQFLKLLKNTAALAGSEAYVNSLFIYKLISAYAEASVPGAAVAHERLSQRFKGQGGRPEEEQPEDTAGAENNNEEV